VLKRVSLPILLKLLSFSNQWSLSNYNNLLLFKSKNLLQSWRWSFSLPLFQIFHHMIVLSFWRILYSWLGSGKSALWLQYCIRLHVGKHCWSYSPRLLSLLDLFLCQILYFLRIYGLMKSTLDISSSQMLQLCACLHKQPSRRHPHLYLLACRQPNKKSREGAPAMYSEKSEVFMYSSKSFPWITSF